MLGNLIRQLVGRAEPAAAAPAHGGEAGEFVRSRLHPLLREGLVTEALIELAPLLARDTSNSAAKHLVEFSLRGIAEFARREYWRPIITYQLGCILLSMDDEEGARLCAGITWGESDAARGYRRFRRGGDLVDHCRAAGLPVKLFPHLDVARMDGLDAPRVANRHTSLCQLRDATVIGESFLPVTDDGVVFTERCMDSPLKLERYDGVQWLEGVRLASDDRLWAAEGETDRHAGPHVLVGNHENIGHWLLFFFSRLRLLEEVPELANAKIVVGESLKPLHLECLRRAGVGEDRLVRLKKGRFAQFDELWVPSFICGVSSSEIMYWTPETIHFMRRVLGVKAPPGGGRRRLFLSRRGARWRRVVNEDALAAALATKGFEEIDAGKLDLQQQIDLAAEAEVIVACFGAAMNFHLLAGEGVPVFQLQPEKRVRMNMHVAITRELGQPFHAVAGRIVTRNADPLKSDFEVDPAAVLQALEGVLDRR